MEDFTVVFEFNLSPEKRPFFNTKTPEKIFQNCKPHFVFIHWKNLLVKTFIETNMTGVRAVHNPLLRAEGMKTDGKMNNLWC